MRRKIIFFSLWNKDSRIFIVYYIVRKKGEDAWWVSGQWREDVRKKKHSVSLFIFFLFLSSSFILFLSHRLSSSTNFCTNNHLISFHFVWMSAFLPRLLSLISLFISFFLPALFYFNTDSWLLHPFSSSSTQSSLSTSSSSSDVFNIHRLYSSFKYSSIIFLLSLLFLFFFPSWIIPSPWIFVFSSSFFAFNHHHFQSSFQW